IGNYPISEDTSLWSGRIDHQWNSRNSSFVRVGVSPSLVTGIQVNAQNQNFGQNAGSRTSLQQTRDLAVVGQHVTSFTGTIFNEARFQFARRGLHYGDRKSTRLNSSHQIISYAVFCLKKKITHNKMHNDYLKLNCTARCAL